MPLGEIKPRELTDIERQRRESWVKLEFPRDIPRLYRMSREEYFSFMYAIDPRMALIFSQEPRYREVLEYQRDKNIFVRLYEEVRGKFNAWKTTH